MDRSKRVEADVIFDSVGGPMFEPALRSLGHRSRQVEITSVGDRRVSFDLLGII
jgi:NADPH:quinone reductase-like Zn-dependent oxidoreductase